MSLRSVHSCSPERQELSRLRIGPEGFALAMVIDGAEYGVTGYMHQAGFVEINPDEFLIACGGNKVPGQRGGDYAGAWTYLWKSEDGGRTFAEVETPFPGNAVGNDERLCPSNPTLVKVAEDHLVMLARSATKNPGESFTYVILSRDKGRTWGTFASGGTDWQWTTIVRFDPELDDTVPRSGDSGFNQYGPACFSARPKRLRSGRIIFSLCASWQEQPPAPQSRTRFGAPLYYSDDDGETWDFLGGIRRPPTGEVLCEPGIQELPDGRLLAIVRAYCTPLPEEDGTVTWKGSRYYYFALSEDGGRNWSEPWPAYLGSERWNGAMPDVAIVGDHLYFAGNFFQYQPADFSGEARCWESGTQRTPLVLVQVPLADVLALRGAQILQPTAIKPVGNTLTQDLYLGSFASVQLQALSDGTLGVLCDTHTRSCDENRILFWKVAPSWFAQDDLALFRGPVPWVDAKDEGAFRVISSQTTVQNIRFLPNRFPVELGVRVTTHRLERRRETIHPVLTLLSNANLNVPTAAHPHPIIAAAVIRTCMPKDGLCRFGLQTGAGLLLTEVPVYNDRAYEVRLVAESRWQVALFVNGDRVAEGPPVCPALPGGFTIGHGDHPAVGLEVGFSGASVSYGGRNEPALAHPFLIDTFRPEGRSPQEWRGEGGVLVLTRQDAGWSLRLPGKHWTNWFRHGGCVLEADDGELVRLRAGEAESVLSRHGGDIVLCHGGKTASLAGSGGRRVAIAASALHERTYLVSDREATSGIRAPLVGDGCDEMEWLIGESVERLAFVAWDFPPAAARRVLEDATGLL